VPNNDNRRHQRIPYLGPIRISWEDAQGMQRYTQARCLDVSEGGVRIEVPVSIPIRTRISLRAERIGLAGSATVKHVARQGTKYILGLSLSQALLDRALIAVREPWTIRKPVAIA
jgi:hypothetical protein